MKGNTFLKPILSTVAVLGMVFAAQAGTRGVSKNEIVVGTHTALSGPVAGWGIDATNGLRMRFDEANEAGGIHGRKIKYIAEDSQYLVPTAVQKANKLVNRDKVFFLIGSIGTPHNNAVFSMLEKKNVPNLFPYTAARSMSEPFHKLKFANLGTYYANVRSGLKYFVEQKGKKSVCMMYVDTDFGMEVVEGVIDQLKAMNMKLVAQTSHKADETNFMGAITQLRDAKCDLVIMGTIIRDTIIAVSTARKIGWDVDMVGQTASCNYMIPLNGGAGVEGFYSVNALPMVYKEQASGKALEIFNKYEKIFNKPFSEVAQHGYVSGDLAVIALQKAGKNLTVNGFIKALESINKYQHPFGDIILSFGPKKHLAHNESILYQIKGGKWVNPSGKTEVLTY
ncbi:ABC transporter substrate-binding protein [bacterium]|nr:ABC transporter substrate-binding protein [bacterium]